MFAAPACTSKCPTGNCCVVHLGWMQLLLVSTGSLRPGPNDTSLYSQPHAIADCSLEIFRCSAETRYFECHGYRLMRRANMPSGSGVNLDVEEQPSWCFLRFRRLPLETINAIRAAMSSPSGGVGATSDADDSDECGRSILSAPSRYGRTIPWHDLTQYST